MEETGKNRYLMYAAATVAVIAVVFFVVKGCALMPWNDSSRGTEVRVTVTRDFGRELLKDERVSVRSSGSAMDALLQAAEVETAYGGGFIHAVDGLASGYSGLDSEKTDWFFYANGQMADVGASDHQVREGDWLVFDYHSWDYSTFTPSLAGCFPAPFTRGYREMPRSCLVLFAPGWEEEGREILALLQEQGAPSCSIQELELQWRPREGDYALVVGTADELEGNLFLSEANDNASRLGMYAFFDGGEMVILDRKGEESRRISSGVGLVQAVGPRLGEDDSALVVTGTDAQGVEAVLNLLLDWEEIITNPVMVMAAQVDIGEIEVPAR
jgi:hypothetical protein